MPSTFSPSLRIELVGDGEQDGIWGQTTNNNLGSLIEQAIAGVTTVDVTSADVTLTSYNGTLDEARSAVLIVNGSNAVTRNVIIPNEPKTYVVSNNTTQTVGVKTSAGTAFSCLTGTQTTLYCDGNNGVFGASTSTAAYNTFVNPLITGIRETITVSATVATGTINYDTLTQTVLYYTSNATANWTPNFRGNGSTTLNSIMSTGQSLAVTFMVSQGATAYYSTNIQVDGASVTPKWQGGFTPSYGNSSSVDVYTYVIIKTGSATFSAFASQTKFA
jgi:hypothetical protein